ncbi:hypothetical protein R1flu_016694 [Riccia fluitans]|uniref:Endoplasmic reticulum transmembrane protein n=1 Tax=Riccia fluitans TaxID=41844 RepID=A0ABD1YMT3_9MARC
MALEWLGLALVAAAEAILLLLLTLPGLEGLRKGLITVAQGLLQPLLAAVPLALFLGSHPHADPIRAPAAASLQVKARGLGCRSRGPATQQEHRASFLWRDHGMLLS